MAGIPKRVLYLKRNRKRLRGFDRFWRDHQHRASIPEPFDITYFAEAHRDYHKLGLYPWAVNEKPPLAIRKLWVARLVADFHNWQQELAAHYTDYYLAVWLYEPDFGRSQLVAGIEKQQVWYEAMVDEPGDLAFPVAYQSLPGVADLQWTARRETTVIWPEDLNSTDSWALKKPYWKAVTAAGQPVIVVQIGWIWVGRAAIT